MKKSTSSVASISNNPVAAGLQELLSSTYTTYLLTHNYHWNVEGPNFYSLHKLLEEQYNELFQSIDEIAERIRALGSYAMPGGLKDVIESESAYASPLKGKSESASEIARTMLSQLVQSNEETVAAAQKAKQAAENAGDDESVDLAVGRITVHQKALWMLKSLLKD